GEHRRVGHPREEVQDAASVTSPKTDASAEAVLRTASVLFWEGSDPPPASRHTSPRWLRNSLERNGEPVLCTIEIDLGAAGQHVRAHVGEDDPLGADLLEAAAQRRVVQVVLHLLVVEIRLDDEEVRVSGRGNEVFHPLGIAGIGYHAAVDLDPERI